MPMRKAPPISGSTRRNYAAPPMPDSPSTSMSMPGSATTLLPTPGGFRSQNQTPTGSESDHGMYTAASDMHNTSQLRSNHGTLNRNAQHRQSQAEKISQKFYLPPDPQQWGSTLYKDVHEPDDDMHDPTRSDDRNKHGIFGFSARGLANLGCIIILTLSLLTLFAGWPLIAYLQRTPPSNLGAFNIGGINSTGQVPDLSDRLQLIDADTPRSAYTKTSLEDGSSLQLVFSDEFNKDGRSFFPGDDPYWEAHDMHYWGTNNLEWYSPEAITTRGGNLVIELSERDIHDLDYMGGLMSTWNKLCFQGGYIEASIVLPGENDVAGLWPAFWTLGNLGRAGYGATLEGTWPYSYDACDVGTLPNQTLNDLPLAASEGGKSGTNGALSYLQGQRLSRCTCDPPEGEYWHPGPKHGDGTFVGRAVPEIDVIEAQVNGNPRFGHVSLTSQIAPFNADYTWDNTSANFEIWMDPADAHINAYQGNEFQQSVSVLANTNQECYEKEGQCYSEYAVEYKPGFDEGYVHWVVDGNQAWSLRGAGLGADPLTEISARPVSFEPMYLILNLGMSHNFGAIDFDRLVFPYNMYVDYVRVYQRPGEVKVSCDPPDMPTASYIAAFPEAYANPNLTTWVDDYKQVIPKNRLVDNC
ncbi:beta-glucan synthesis-associated [Pterulicium gracile]|uniref:Beta-glucan synthesis-associated n=1 Tax=Pterulicium gracile TaxID=1884261 RepID=A0A5C3QE48_9AGAR|nr:beta-glucan synthesis-associated [Pterula gracilis]